MCCLAPSRLAQEPFRDRLPRAVAPGDSFDNNSYQARYDMKDLKAAPGQDFVDWFEKFKYLQVHISLSC